ncbi:hypothetical protein EI94DRAFT_1749124 [Lactarius quietus]|nr:hypothetical protein EI94DRAFT_1749124 [Lactarius quietus]
MQDMTATALPLSLPVVPSQDTLTSQLPHDAIYHTLPYQSHRPIYPHDPPAISCPTTPTKDHRPGHLPADLAHPSHQAIRISCKSEDV